VESATPSISAPIATAEFNLYGYDVKSKGMRILTAFKDFPVLNAAAFGSGIILEQGRLSAYPGHRLRQYEAIGDRRRRRSSPPRGPHFVKGMKYARATSLSPTGARVAMEFRGEIVTVPAEKRRCAQSHHTVAANERSPIWSPDGKSIAYFSDESGEYELHVRAQGRQRDREKIRPARRRLLRPPGLVARQQEDSLHRQ